MAAAVVRLAGRKTEPAGARLVAAGLVVRLPAWPAELDVTGAADTWQEQERPGRVPLLRRVGLALPAVRVDGLPVGTGGLDESCAPVVAGLRRLARTRTPAQLWTGTVRVGRFRITELGWTVTDWTPSGDMSRCEVAMTLTAASDAAAPVGPVGPRPARPAPPVPLLPA